jgi:ABC-type phosphonate transport system ATPase subunit
MRFERTGYDVLMCMKTKELDWKENYEIQTTNIEDSPGNMKVDQRQVQKIWKNFITKFYN